MDVWVDGHGLVRKLVIAFAIKQNGQPLSSNVQVEYFDFGPTATVTPPASSEVFDITGQSLAGLSGVTG